MNDSHVAVADKRRLRAVMRARRAALRPEQCRIWSAVIRRRLSHLRRFRKARVVFIYVSCGTEVQTEALIRSLLQQGRVVCVPRIMPDRSMRAVAIRCWSDLVSGRHGIPAPRSTRLRRDVEVALVPGAAFSEQGERLGLGAGYYDRWFASWPRVWRIAMAYEAQITTVPTAAHDKPMHLIVTEKRIIRV